MAIMLADIASRLQNGTIGTIGATTGWTIRVAEIPNAPDTCVSLYEYAGLPSDLTLDGTRDVTPGLQVRVRGERNGYIAARQKAEAISVLLDGISNITINGTKYKYIFATQQPSFMGLDENQRPMWVQNFRVCKEP